MHKKIHGSVRDMFGTPFIESYLKKHKIQALFTGHQDQTNIAFMLPSNSPGNWHVDNPRYEDYELVQPKKSEYVNGECTLTPGKDFLALVTSTATVSRNLPDNTYLLLQ